MFCVYKQPLIPAGQIYKSVTAFGKGKRAAQENAAYKLLRSVGETEFEVDIDNFSEQ